MNELIEIQTPYLLLLGDIDSIVYAKTAFGLKQWCPENCAGQWRFDGCTLDLDLPEMTPATAAEQGIKTVVVGVAPRGGSMSQAWINSLLEATRAGLDIASGMHLKLNDVPELKAASTQYGTTLHDVRIPPTDLPIATGAKRSGSRVLTVGTDCAVGKKYTALALHHYLQQHHLRSDFRATGQTGILISGRGIPIDAVVSDFVAGAAEILSPANDDDHWDVIEGQGSLFNPAYAGVTLGLLHGSQPDAIVLCHDLARTSIAGIDGFPVPDIQEAIELYLSVGKLTNSAIACVGVSVNSSSLGGAAREQALKSLEDQLDLPCVDPLIDGVEPIVSKLLASQ
ncbi:MAG: DUF1611 domain-containing protein [Pseudomonadota bacterium]